MQRLYEDEAESGVSEDGKEPRRLLRDCRAGPVQSLILPSLDRLSRDVRIAENLCHEFGVDVLIADMPTYNGRDRKNVLVVRDRDGTAKPIAVLAFMIDSRPPGLTLLGVYR